MCGKAVNEACSTRFICFVGATIVPAVQEDFLPLTAGYLFLINIYYCCMPFIIIYVVGLFIVSPQQSFQCATLKINTPQIVSIKHRRLHTW